MAFLAELRLARIHFSLAQVRDEGIMVQVVVPGERWEIEFMDDGDVQVERFLSKGQIEHGDGALRELLSRFSDPPM